MKFCLAFLLGLVLFIQHGEACNCCPYGWVPYGGSCYYFTTWTTDWYEARKYCLGTGANLVCLSGWSEWSFILKRIGQLNIAFGSKDYWIGVNDIASEGTWRCANGSPGYLRWNGGEPNNHGGNEDCVHSTNNGKMNDRPCNHNHLRLICKKSC